MATIFVYPDVDIGIVEATLNRLAKRLGDQWLVESGPLFVMLFDGTRLTPEDGFDQAEIDRISAARGRALTCAVYIEIAGRAGSSEARGFVEQVLAACGGGAEDEASEHLWTLAEMSAGARVGHHRFYDARRYGE